MRILMLALGVLLVGGCAFPTAVQRVAVEYNSAVAGMANELTLLNIMRAREDLPLHYTSVSALRGNITVKAGGSINSALRGDGTTTTDQIVDTLSTQVAPPGTTSTTTSAITGINQVVEGVDITTPSLSGEITTGPTFDVAVLDTQKFYNGILAAIPFSTVENYIGQGFDNQLLTRLLIERVEIKYVDGATHRETTISWINEPGTPEGQEFAERMACYTLKGTNLRVDPIDLVPVSRLRRNDGASLVGLTLQEVALLDGKSLEVSQPIGSDPNTDRTVVVRRPASSKRVAELVPRREVLEKDPGNLSEEEQTVWSKCRQIRERSRRPEAPPSEPLFLGEGNVLTLGPDGRTDTTVKADMTVVFRSAESVIRYVGRYLRASVKEPLDGGTLFAVVNGNARGALVSCELLGKRYSIAAGGDGRHNMQVIAIIQQLINLHKESSDRPQTIPVQVVGS